MCKTKTSCEWQFCGRKCTVDERRQRNLARMVRANRKAMVTLYDHGEQIQQQRPHRVSLLSAGNGNLKVQWTPGQNYSCPVIIPVRGLNWLTTMTFFHNLSYLSSQGVPIILENKIQVPVRCITCLQEETFTTITFSLLYSVTRFLYQKPRRILLKTEKKKRKKQKQLTRSGERWRRVRR